MKSKSIYRVLFIVGAFVIGYAIVYLMSIAGDKSKGPLESMLSSAEEGIVNLENSLLIEDRVAQRKEKLKWFEPYRKNINKLKHPDKILIGASDASQTESYENIINLEDSLETTFPIIHIYNAWGSKPEEQFPALAVKTILGMGSTPMITWEPWLSDFDAVNYPTIPEDITKRDKEGVLSIAEGNYDQYIRKYAKEVKKIGEPIMIRFAHEMNDPYRYPWGPQNNKPEDFVIAWQHVHDIFEEEGATNVVWIWSPHPSYEYFEAFYPGEEYVDYVALGVLNFGTSASWSQWWSFDDLLGNGYDVLKQFNKPIMIAEFGSLNVGGDRGEWFADALKDLPSKYPQVKSIVYFHYPVDKTLTDKQISWYFINDSDVLDSIKTSIKSWADSLQMK